MTSSSLPIPSSATQSAASGPTVSAPAGVAREAVADLGSDFVQMLAELMGTSDASPQAIMNALQTLQSQKSPGKDDAQNSPDAGLLLDPQFALLLAGSAQLAVAANSAAQNEANRTIEVDAGRARVPGLELGPLGALGATDDSASLAATLLTDKAGDDSKTAAQTAPQGEGKPADPTVNAMTSNADRVASAPERAQIRAHVGTPAWADELAGKLTVMIGRGVHSASLTLSPEQLGPMEIRISVQSDQTSVWFGAAHAATRTALEQALPRLRELLAGQGLNLSDAGVFREAPRDRTKTYSGGNETGSEEHEVAIASVAARGIVDAYA